MENKIKSLQKILIEQNLDGFMFSTADEYINEYVPDHLKRLFYLTNFSGSFGYVIVLQNKAAIFVDGRYTIQVKQEVNPSLFEIYDYDFTNITSFLQKNLKQGSRVGIYSKICKIDEFNTMEFLLEKIHIKIILLNTHLVDEIIHGEKDFVSKEIYHYAIEYSGETYKSKINKIKQEMAKYDLDYLLITQLDNIAWSLNLRGSDVRCNPLFLSKLLVIKDGKSKLFCQYDKIHNDIKKEMEEDVDFYQEDDLLKAFDMLHRGKCFGLSNQSPIYYLETLKDLNFTVKIVDNIPSYLKATKNHVEINNTINAHIRDGAYVVSFLYELLMNHTKYDEMLASKMLKDIRSKDKLYRDDSFESIVACDGNGAIVHYRPSIKTNKSFHSGNVLLLDSGAQYLDGTTDITRTLFFSNNVTHEFKTHYTVVLKSHMALARMIFKRGITCSHLDVIAREPMWKLGLNYSHGTGHGVGVFLCVHEMGPSISLNNNLVLQEGMIFSNEPGLYIPNQYGIRLENLYVVVKSEYGDFLKLQSLTLVPFESKSINYDMLNDDEKKWLEGYQNNVYEKLSQSGILNENQKKWLFNYINSGK